jgi:hypothetical protein
MDKRMGRLLALILLAGSIAMRTPHPKELMLRNYV